MAGLIEATRAVQIDGRSTGPTTKAGKTKVARNADKGFVWKKLRESEVWLNKYLREQKASLNDIQGNLF